MSEPLCNFCRHFKWNGTKEGHGDLGFRCDLKAFKCVLNAKMPRPANCPLDREKTRVSWDEYFMQFAIDAAKRSTCVRRQVGAVAVFGKRVLVTGYNGAASGQEHCFDVGCLREKLNIPSGEKHELCRAIHAEQNLIIQAALFGVSLKGSIIYCTTQPCSICAKMLLGVQIEKVVYLKGYPDEATTDLLKGKLEKYEGEIKS